MLPAVHLRAGGLLMRTSTSFALRCRVGLGRAVSRFRADCRGVTAIEFGMVALPFAGMMTGIMAIGLQYFTEHALESAVLDASRKLRTGQAQKAGITVADFRQQVCDGAEGYVACDENLVVHVTSQEHFSDLVPTPCVTNGRLTPSEAPGSDLIQTRAGVQNAAVLVTACYEWQMGASLWQPVWDLVSPYPRVAGKTILSATSVFRSEPYE